MATDWDAATVAPPCKLATARCKKLIIDGSVGGIVGAAVGASVGIAVGTTVGTAVGAGGSVPCMWRFIVGPGVGTGVG